MIYVPRFIHLYHTIRSQLLSLCRTLIKGYFHTLQVVFNCIDYGEYFDYAATSLCAALGLPYISASSYGHTAIAECYPALDYPSKGPCWACNNQPTGVELLQRITPKEILQLDCLSFLPKVWASSGEGQRPGGGGVCARNGNN